MTAASSADSLQVDPIDELIAAASTAAPQPDTRPEVLVAVASMVDPYTCPPTILVRLRVQGEGQRLYRLERACTAAEATLHVLVHLVAHLEGPTRVSVAVDDPTVDRLLRREIRTPPWLRRAADALEYEAAIIETTVLIEHLDLGDEVAPLPLGDG